MSDHAVVDRHLNTMHVFTGVEIGRIPAFVRSMHRSPVPLARSSTVLPLGSARSRTARFRQRTSSRKEMIRLRRSYFGAIASNMSRTAATFSSPSGSWSVSQDRAVLTPPRLGPGSTRCSARLVVTVGGDLAGRLLVELFDLGAGLGKRLQLDVGVGHSLFE